MMILSWETAALCGGGLLIAVVSYLLVRRVGKWRPYTTFRESYYPKFTLRNSQTIGSDVPASVKAWSASPFTLTNQATGETFESQKYPWFDRERRKPSVSYLVDPVTLEPGQEIAIKCDGRYQEIQVAMWATNDTWVQGRYSNLPDTGDEATERFWTINMGACLVWMMVLGCGAFGILLLLPY